MGPQVQPKCFRHVALIYFQKMLQVLTSHTSKLPKKVLKNTKNMTPNSCSVRPEKFHPYILGTTCFPVEVTRASSRNSFLNKVHYYPDRPPYEQIPYQGDYCLSRHHLIHNSIFKLKLCFMIFHDLKV